MTNSTSSALDRVTWPRYTQRLSLRPATTADTAVSQWLPRAPRTLDEFRSQFEDPDSLTRTLVIELDGAVIGDLMLRVEDAWA